MKSTTFLAYFLALFAMFFGLSSTTSAEMITDLEPRAAAPTKPVGAAFDATIDLLVKEHSDIVVKAFADVCTDANLSTDITTDIRVQISGLINIDFGLGTRLSAALRSSIKAAVRTEVDLETKAQFSANLRTNLAAIITKRCPAHDSACIKLQAKNIVKDAIKFTTKASVKISDKISVNLATRVKAAIQIQVKKFSVNLWLIKINVTGDVEVSNSVSLRFKNAAGLVASACADISAKLVSQIKTIASI
ncbi:hypothetical protein BGZ89_008080 [Linnemannia elongata]|uniref:Lipid-binding serum glycoprotein N-terminal domain-containing protein n=1 Tax=Linnemannia elongata AG-77 TaxID=1314771 RepID=A0A197JR48_9FUNG|nr:hypothetical protein BGZ91_012354 [Linnemannia elongata]KAG0065644.1 hypothetical protein BGZ89_008080 [Linnemannia elongata]KAG0074974.1 hypothetical protein BGZ90_010319 [Linnemannia elongata]OAQ27438.1 hypothetical protein K457DRAFT_21318 [Linnemannia elongata AG-77]